MIVDNDLHKIEEEMRENKPELQRVGLSNKIKGSVRVPSELFERGKHLSSPAKWLYIILKSFTDEDTGKIFASYRQIRQRSGLTHSAVAKRLEELEQFCWIERVKSRGLQNGYVLCRPSFRDFQTGKESGDQIYPTKALAKAWALTKRSKKMKK